ncbi:exo-alpha-sialidase [Ktedonobacter racemifer]|nr:exo-alpha-sialidase [Ktedonobacter racemifer]
MGSILPDNSGGSKTGIWNNIRMFPDGGGWALTYRALLHTSDGGRHWHSATPWDSSIGAIGVIPYFVNSHVAWFIVPGNTIYVQYGKSNESQLARSYRTTDGGATWQSGKIPGTVSTYSDAKSGAGAVGEAVKHLVAQGETRHYININSLMALDAQSAWISVGQTYIHTGGGQEDIHPESNRILHSTDGGRNWNLLVEDKPDAQNRVAGTHIYFVNSILGIQSGKTPLGIEISHDGGKSWHEEELPLPKLKVFSLPTTNQEESVFFNERDGIIPVYMLVGRSYKLFYYTTHDGAQSWQVGTLSNDLADQPQVTYLDSQHWMILQKAVILKTNDDGVQWTSAVPQLPGKAVINSNFILANEGWAIVSNVDHFDANTSGLDSSTSLLQTKDGGKTWQIMSYQVA